MLVGQPTIGPFVGVVDVAQVGSELAAGMLASEHQQPGRLARRTLEQPAAATHVDRDPGGVDDDAPQVTGQRRPQHVVRVQRHAAARLATEGVQ